MLDMEWFNCGSWCERKETGFLG